MPYCEPFAVRSTIAVGSPVARPAAIVSGFALNVPPWPMRSSRRGSKSPITSARPPSAPAAPSAARYQRTDPRGWPAVAARQRACAAAAAALVERLKRKFPEQFAPAKPPPSIDAGAGVAEVPQLTKEALAKMKPAEIAGVDWEEVKRVLAAG